MPHSMVPKWQRQMARVLRKEPTPSERVLWKLLKEMRRQRVAHFRRQVPIGPFIVDFADLGRMLVVEADGGQHGSARDERRDAWLKDEGFQVIRLWNNEILSNPDGIWRLISDALEERVIPTPIPSPQGGGETLPSGQGTSSLPLGGRVGVGVSHPHNPHRKSQP